MKISVYSYLILLLLSLSLTGYSQDITSWYRIMQKDFGFWIIDDHGAANIYVLEGDEKALVIDTGLGVANLIEVIRFLTDKPLVVVNTHGHPDHSGGNYQFEKIYMHKDDIEAAKMYSSKEQRGQVANTMLNGEKPAESDLYTGEVYNPEYIPISEGYIFDLGNHKIEVIETPGHTPGSICLLDKKREILFTGDNNNLLVWLFLDNSLPLSEYLKTLEKQRSRISEYSAFFTGHGEAVPSFFVRMQIECVKSILDGTCESEPYHSFAGDARICTYRKAQIAYNPDNL